MNRALEVDLAARRDRLVQLCRKYEVMRLDIFGSATGDRWRERSSDIDFIVVFERSNEPGIADRYLGLAEDLEALFGRSVDLVTEGSIQNPYFREEVEATRTPVYAA